MTAFPVELIHKGLFCCWKYEDRCGRRTKGPYQPVTGANAKSNDPASFVPYETAVQTRGYDGIGIGIFDGICAIDLDHCISDSGYYTETAAEIVSIMHSYTEYSPSGDGLHILFRADGFSYPSDRYYIMNHPANIEVYVAGATNKYVTVTGNACEAYEFGDRTEELNLVLEKFMRRPDPSAGNANNAANQADSELFQQVVPLTPQWSELPLFPVDALPPVIRDYVSAVAEHSQTAPDMAAVISLGVLATCLQGKYRVEGTPGYYEPLSLYTVIIAAPGERKSSVMRDMTQFLYEYEQDYNTSHSQEIRENRQQRGTLERQISGLQKKLERKQDREAELELQQMQEQLENLPELKPARFFADDCSSER